MELLINLLLFYIAWVVIAASVGLIVFWFVNSFLKR